MTGREIRAWAREWVRGRRGILILAGVLVGIPSLLVAVAQNTFHVTAPFWVTIPVSFLSTLLSFGCMKLALDLVEGRPGRISCLGFSFSGGMFGKAALVALCLSLASFLVNLGPNLLFRSEQLGVLLLGLSIDLVLLVVYNTLTFLVGYRLVLSSGDGALTQLKEGIALGVHQFWDILVFGFWLELPLAGVTVGLILLTFPLAFSLWATMIGIPLILIAFIAFACWYSPYMVLATAAFAEELLQPEQSAAQNTVIRLMRLRAGGGGWYWCPLERGPVWTGTPVCRRRGKKG